LIKKIDTLNIPFDYGKTILHAAVERGSSKVLPVLLYPTNKEKMNLNSQDQDGFTPLHSAVFLENVDFTRQLLDADADPDSLNIDDAAPIHTAALRKNADLMKVLVEFKADLNRTHLNKQNYTAAHIAAACDNVKVIEVLLAAKADFRKKDTKGLTPLGVASLFGADTSAKVMCDNLKEEDCRDDLLEVRKKLQDALEAKKGSGPTVSLKR
jgi:ankyrin repeat protein